MKTRKLVYHDDVSPYQPADRKIYRSLKHYRVVLHLLEFNIKFVLNLNQSILVGRSIVSGTDFRALDLTPFRAEELGVSRRHLTIMLKDSRLTIVDNGSSNGTFVNGYLVHPDEYVSLTQDDNLRLGFLEFEIDFLAGE